MNNHSRVNDLLRWRKVMQWFTGKGRVYFMEPAMEFPNEG